MILPVVKLASGLVTVASSLASKCTSDVCLSATIRGKVSAPVVGATVGMVTADTVPLSSSSINPILLQSIRGGAATSAVANFSRERLFLQGLATYGTITALIMNASLRLWTSTKFSKEQNKIVSNVFNIATALCIMSGAFTAIMFQLLSIYSKSALGMGNDEGYIAFKAATRAFRVWGFRCFLTEMVSFVVCFMSRLYNTLWDDARKQRKGDDQSTLTTTGKFIMGGSVILMLLGAYLIRSVLSLATLYIYSKETNDFTTRLVVN